MRSGCRGFESRSGHFIFSGICSVYIDRHIRVDLSDDEQYMFDLCHVTYILNKLLGLPFTANKVTTFRNSQLCHFFNFIEAKACDLHF